MEVTLFLEVGDKFQKRLVIVDVVVSFGSAIEVVDARVHHVFTLLTGLVKAILGFSKGFVCFNLFVFLGEVI